MAWISERNSDFKYKQSCGVITEFTNGINKYRISYESSEWPAQSSQEFHNHKCSPGDIVKVINRSNITLIFEPISSRKEYIISTTKKSIDQSLEDNYRSTNTSKNSSVKSLLAQKFRMAYTKVWKMLTGMQKFPTSNNFK